MPPPPLSPPSPPPPSPLPTPPPSPPPPSPPPPGRRHCRTDPPPYHLTAVRHIPPLPYRPLHAAVFYPLPLLPSAVFCPCRINLPSTMSAIFPPYDPSATSLRRVLPQSYRPSLATVRRIPPVGITLQYRHIHSSPAGLTLMPPSAVFCPCRIYLLLPPSVCLPLPSILFCCAAQFRPSQFPPHCRHSAVFHPLPYCRNPPSVIHLP